MADHVYHYNGPGQGLILIGAALLAIVCGLSLFRQFARQGRRDAARRGERRGQG
jgi:uncharacterized membrane protein SpoIIM required for sporulation